MTDTKMNSIKDAKRLFDLTLFWDAESVDIEQHADYIIAKVLDFGDEKDLKTRRGVYADEKLIGVLKERRGLMRMTRRFWSVYFNITLPELKNDRDLLPQKALNLIDKLAIQLDTFYLARGTALALQLGHRVSDFENHLREFEIFLINGVGD